MARSKGRRGGAASSERAIAHRKRLSALAKLYIAGVRDRSQLAAAFGVGLMVISNDLRELFDGWLKEDIRSIAKEKSIACRQMDFGALEAINAWERSKQNREVITTEYLPRNCPDCKGSGFVEDTEKWCPTCDGEGRITVENVTRKIEGQAGDSSLLSSYREFIKERAKIKGLYPDSESMKKGKSQPNTIELHANARIDFSKASPEILLEVVVRF